MQKKIICIACMVVLFSWNISFSKTAEVEDEEIFISTTLCPTKQAMHDTLKKPLVYVPWREDYITDTHEKPKARGCPFCLIRDGEDSEYLVIMRCEYNYVMLNHYPYTRGHMMIVPYDHVGTLSELSVEAKNELMMLITECCEFLSEAVGADGFNIGINIGKASAASIPEHIHVQVLPRFNCEPMGYLNLLGETRIVYWNLQKLYQRLKSAFIDYHESRKQASV